MNPVDSSRSVAIVSSRFGRFVARESAWLAGLRAALRKISSHQLRIVVGDETAGAAFIAQAASRLKIPHTMQTTQEVAERLDDLPGRDRELIEAVDVVYVLQLRSGGNVHRLLQERLAQKRGPVILVDLPELQDAAAKTELCIAGAELWRPSEDECRSLDCDSIAAQPRSHSTAHTETGVSVIAPFPESEHWQFLTHSTRAQPGPWPDESFEQYADSLLESRPDADHSALGTLRRIISQKKLVATARTIRGGERVVSFTACPLADLPALHRFRPHQVRWDFEPFGLCLRRDWLVSQGARCVKYGDDSVWQSLPDEDRPFFQLAIGRSGIDWTVEQEWRICGDLTLSDISPGDVLLFVPNFESAKSLGELTDWPITLWPGEISNLGGMS